MDVHRLHLKPQSSKDFDKTAEFCIQNNIVGVGWGVNAPQEAITSFNDYEKYARQKYKRTQAGYFYNRIAVGDLVWAKTDKEVFYLCRVESPWEYLSTEESRYVDIYNIVRVEMYEVPRAHAILEKVNPEFRNANAIQKIRDENIIKSTEALWEELSREAKAS